MRRLAVLVPSLAGGGAERIAVNLAAGFVERGIEVDLLLVRPDGPLRSYVPPGVRIVPLRGGRIAASLPSLVGYLRRCRPEAVLSHLDTMNVTALFAHWLARSPARIVVTTHVAVGRHAAGGPRRRRFTRWLIPRLYTRADAVVGVSRGVVEELERHIGPGRARTVTIYNPVVRDGGEIHGEAGSESDLEGLEGAGCGRMLLSVGRLSPQKNHALLIDAVAPILKAQPDTCLVILGEGAERGALEARIEALGLSGRVTMPGFVRDTGRYYRAASVFVLSSDWEGLPTVLIEAMSHGCPVVSTRCPSGPEEILDSGTYGRLVEPGDADALTRAIVQALAEPTDPDTLRRRAGEFSFSRAVDEYLALLFPEAPASPRRATG